MIVKRLFVGATGLAVLGAGALFATPAQAAIPADGVYVDTDTDGAGPLDTADGSILVVKTAKDDGGIPYHFAVKWVKKYRDPAGTLRVSVPSLVVYRSDGDVTAKGQPEDAGADIHFDVRDHGTTIIQHKNLNNVDLDAAADNRVTFNPRNPVSDVGDTDIRVRAGTDGDGLGASDWVYFVQPEGLPTPAAG
jgi:hypothetical protein